MAHKIRVITVLTVVFSFWAIGVSAQDLNEGIVGYWPLDGNGKDESGNGNDAKLEKGAVWSDNGWVNGAVEVDKRLATIGLPVESAGKLAVTWASLKRN